MVHDTILPDNDNNIIDLKAETFNHYNMKIQKCKRKNFSPNQTLLANHC